MTINRRTLLGRLGEGLGCALLPGEWLGAPVGARPLLGAAALSRTPRRNRLTKTFGGGVMLRPQIDRFTAGGVPLTFLYAVPIEAPCYAVRLGFGNCFSPEMTIASASVWPSDSYSACAALHAARRTRRPTAVAPTGGAPEGRVFFDHRGADVGFINPGGSQRSLTIPGVATNRWNARQAFTIQWSDFSPCVSVPPADGGARHILFIYVTVASPAMSSDTSRLEAADLDPIALRGRATYRAMAWQGGRDWSGDPQGTAWKQAPFGPLFCLQYLSASPGVQIVLNGDSLATAPTNDWYSTPLQRAAWDLSGPAFPIEVANLAWGGADWATYGPLLLRNAAAVQPSAVAYQPLSRNDGHGTAILRLLLARSIMLAEQMGVLYGANALYNSPGNEPSWNGDAAAIAGFIDLRGRLNALAEESGVPVIDGPSVLGPPSAPWTYLPGLSDDNTHTNFAGAEAVVPLARAALLRLIEAQ